MTQALLPVLGGMQHQLSPYVASVSSAANQNNQNAPCSSNEALSGGMAIRRRRRKKRETVEEPSLVDTTQPSNMEIGLFIFWIKDIFKLIYFLSDKSAHNSQSKAHQSKAKGDLLTLVRHQL